MRRISLSPPRRVLLTLFPLFLSLYPNLLIAQQRSVDPGQTHERLIAIVPLEGAGTMADPKRPMFAPAGNRGESPALTKLAPQSKSAILAYSWHLSDDGKSAIVEFVARDQAAFAAILSSKDARVQTFQRGKNSKDEMEAALKKAKKDFDPKNFGVKMN